MAYTLDELEAALAERIAALDAAPYQQGLQEVWAESDIPLTAQQDSVLQQHLAFSVAVEDAPVVDDGQVAGGFVSVLATAVVTFVYRLRSSSQRADQRTAIRAARAVLGALLAPSPMWGAARALSAYRPRPITGEWHTIDLRIEVGLDLSVPPPSP